MYVVDSSDEVIHVYDFATQQPSFSVTDELVTGITISADQLAGNGGPITEVRQVPDSRGL